MDAARQPEQRWWAAVRNDKDATRVVVGGEIDFGSREAMLQLISDTLHGLASELVIDLRDVSFMDSTGLQVAVLIPAARAHDLGLPVQVLPSNVVRKKLELAGLSDLLPQ